ncbi:MAG: transcription termination factor Rho [Nitrososphaerales archaeon]
MAEPASGILRRGRPGRGRDGFVLVNAVQPAAGDVFVPPRLVQQYALVEGATVAGPLRAGREGRELAGVETVCGVSPAAYRSRPPFEKLIAIDPTERFNLAASGDIAMRAVDLLAPIGRGTRGLIVAPPKAGKTTMLEGIARAIRADRPAARIVVLLVDERPEELTYFRRNVAAEVFASSSDQSPAEHTSLAEFLLAHIRVELECGNDIVVLLDSLTRLARAFNLGSRGSGRSLSGGMDAASLVIPRRFFGAARNVEDGGSVTLLATSLIDTGSRMDQLIYEELKSTGNSEIVLDRDLAQEQIFPAIDVHRTGTRKEERLYTEAEMAGVQRLRRALAGYPPRQAMRSLLRILGQYPGNAALLEQLARSAGGKPSVTSPS